jgi:hypothetical protein
MRSPAADDLTIVVDGRAVLRLEPEPGRVRVHLVVPGIGRSVEVTGAPTTALHALDDAAARHGCNPSRVHAEARRALRHAVEVSGAWSPGASADLTSWFGGAAYPLLAAAYAAGAGPIATVPRWADAILAEPGPRPAARLAFDHRATRPVVAALAHSLIRIPDAPVDLSRLALALGARDMLVPDRLAALLTADGPAWPTSSLPTPRRLAQVRSVTRFWGAERTFGYLRQAAADAAGRRIFSDCVDHALDLQSHAPIRLPATLEELRAVYRLHVRTTGRAGEPPRPPRPVAATAGARPVDPAGPVDYGMFYAPRVECRTPITDATPIAHPRWLGRVDRTTTNGFSFVLPHTCGDLLRWAAAMTNCLDSFRPAAVEGVSHLVGVTTGGRLRYVLEIDPDRHIRQFSGRANRPVDRVDHDTIVDHLRSRGALA